jgi:hypothetical protein
VWAKISQKMREKLLAMAMDKKFWQRKSKMGRPPV